MLRKADIFQVIGDPASQKKLQLLVLSCGLNIHSIAEKVEVSRQGVSKRTKMLEKAGWVGLFTKKPWVEQLLSLESYLDSTPDLD